MKIEHFLANIIYNMAIDRSFILEAEAAGIDFLKTPKCLATELGERFIGLHRRAGFEAARDSIKDDLRYFEIEGCLDLKNIPRNHQALSYAHKEAMKTYEYEQLAKALMSSPHIGDEILKSFNLKEVKTISWLPASSVVDHAVAEIKQRILDGKEVVVSLPDYPRFSEMIGGFNPQRIHIILGQTGFGKTNLALNLSISAAKKATTAYVNMEMGFQDIGARILACSGDLTFDQIRSGNFDYDQSSNKNLLVTSGKTLSLSQIISWLRVLKADRPDLFLAFIDYDQKIDIELAYGEQEWKIIQRVVIQLEELAKELDICIVVLSQVNREQQISSSWRATFSAHSVLAFYQSENDGPVVEAKKNRHGKTGTVLKMNYIHEKSQVIEDRIIELSKREIEIPMVPKKYKPENQRRSHWNDQ
jgi:RecA/RadA recombinase